MSIQSSLLHGRLAGQKCGHDWPLLYVELYETSFHIFEGNDDPSRPRRQILTLEINSTDLVYNKDKPKKRDYRFQYERYEGKYTFKCTSPEERTSWVNNLQKMIQRKEYTEKGVLPESQYSQASHSPSTLRYSQGRTPSLTSTSPKANKYNSLPGHAHRSIDSTTPPPPPPHKRDSGFVSGTGDARTYRPGTGSNFSGDSVISHGDNNKSHSGDSAIVHNTSVVVDRLHGCHSDDGKFRHRTDLSDRPMSDSSNDVGVDEEEMSRYDWYWGEMTRDDCTRALKEKGNVGNFVVRKNNRGDYVMSFWRKDTVHHHRILRSANVFQFEKSVVQATGENIPDLLDTYMKCCTDKTIGPYGGQLYPNYDNPWNPPDIDFNKMSLHLQKVKNEKGQKRLFKAGAGMGDHTYGGLTLKQMTDVLESSEMQAVTTHPNQRKAIPTPFASVSPSDLKLNSPKRKPLAAPKPNKRGSVATPFSQETDKSNKGYVNFYKTQGGTPVLPKQEEEEEFSDDEQEVYIAPGNLPGSDNEDSSIYMNVTRDSPPMSPKHNDDNVYQNFVVTPPTLRKQSQQLENNTPKPTPRPNSGSTSLYANVTFDGKPKTQPRKYGGRRVS